VKLNLIAKQSKGRSFRGLLNYLLSKEGAEIVGGNMIGDNAKELAAEFSASRKLRPSLSRVVYHSSLSLPHGESLSDEKWRDISQQYVSKMGFKGSQYVAVKHTDTEHSHVHIVASRISMDGRVVSDSHDFKRSESIVRGIERDYGLTRVAPSREAQAKAPKTGELHKSLRELEPSTKMLLKHAIDQARTNRPTMSDFIGRLEKAGVGVIPNIAKTGTVTGLSFEIDGQTMKGSDIGRGYTWQGLQKQGVNYEKNRDIRSINQAKIRAAIRRGRDDGNRIHLPGGSGLTRGSDQKDQASNRFRGGTVDYSDIGIEKTGEGNVRDFEGVKSSPKRRSLFIERGEGRSVEAMQKHGGVPKYPTKVSRPFNGHDGDEIHSPDSSGECRSDSGVRVSQLDKNVGEKSAKAKKVKTKEKSRGLDIDFFSF